MAGDDYEITKDDVEKMLRYLRLNLPQYATPEKAIYLLEHQHMHYKNLEELHPEMIEQFLKDFEK